MTAAKFDKTIRKIIAYWELPISERVRLGKKKRMQMVRLEETIHPYKMALRDKLHNAVASKGITRNFKPNA
jgi:hypothetical protein